MAALFFCGVASAYDLVPTSSDRKQSDHSSCVPAVQSVSNSCVRPEELTSVNCTDNDSSYCQSHSVCLPYKANFCRRYDPSISISASDSLITTHCLEHIVEGGYLEGFVYVPVGHLVPTKYLDCIFRFSASGSGEDDGGDDGDGDGADSESGGGDGDGTGSGGSVDSNVNVDDFSVDINQGGGIEVDISVASPATFELEQGDSTVGITYNVQESISIAVDNVVSITIATGGVSVHVDVTTAAAAASDDGVGGGTQQPLQVYLNAGSFYSAVSLLIGVLNDLDVGGDDDQGGGGDDSGGGDDDVSAAPVVVTVDVSGLNAAVEELGGVVEGIGAAVDGLVDGLSDFDVSVFVEGATVDVTVGAVTVDVSVGAVSVAVTVAPVSVDISVTVSIPVISITIDYGTAASVSVGAGDGGGDGECSGFYVGGDDNLQTPPGTGGDLGAILDEDGNPLLLSYLGSCLDFTYSHFGTYYLLPGFSACYNEQVQANCSLGGDDGAAAAVSVSVNVSLGLGDSALSVLATSFIDAGGVGSLEGQAGSLATLAVDYLSPTLNFGVALGDGFVASTNCPRPAGDIFGGLNSVTVRAQRVTVVNSLGGDGLNFCDFMDGTIFPGENLIQSLVAFLLVLIPVGVMLRSG